MNVGSEGRARGSEKEANFLCGVRERNLNCFSQVQTHTLPFDQFYLYDLRCFANGFIELSYYRRESLSLTRFLSELILLFSLLIFKNFNVVVWELVFFSVLPQYICLLTQIELLFLPYHFANSSAKLCAKWIFKLQLIRFARNSWNKIVSDTQFIDSVGRSNIFLEGGE